MCLIFEIELTNCLLAFSESLS